MTFSEGLRRHTGPLCLADVTHQWLARSLIYSTHNPFRSCCQGACMFGPPHVGQTMKDAAHQDSAERPSLHELREAHLFCSFIGVSEGLRWRAGCRSVAEIAQADPLASSLTQLTTLAKLSAKSLHVWTPCGGGPRGIQSHKNPAEWPALHELREKHFFCSLPAAWTARLRSCPSSTAWQFSAWPSMRF